MERNPIINTSGELASSVYVADTYVHNRPNKNQRYLMPYYVDKFGMKACYFPINSFGKREPKLKLTLELMDKCVREQVPIILETRTTIPEWAVERMAKVRGSLLIVQVPTLNKTMKRRFFKSVSSPNDLRDMILKVFQTGTNVRLKFAPVIPSVTKLPELIAYMNEIKAFLIGVEIGFSSLTEADLLRIEKRNKLKAGTLRRNYNKVDGVYFLRSDIKEDTMLKIRMFCEGNGIDLYEY